MEKQKLKTTKSFKWPKVKALCVINFQKTLLVRVKVYSNAKLTIKIINQNISYIP